MNDLVSIVFLTLLGLAIGSFQNVLISRISRSESILGRSYCESCGKKIPAIENIPVVSYLVLAGKCRTCGVAIGSRHLLIELATPLLFSLGFAIAQNGTALFLWLNLVVFGLPLAAIDYKVHRLPNSLNYTFFATTLLIITLDSVINDNYQLILSSAIQAIALFIFYIGLRVISKGGMGIGDAKLGLTIGLISGYFGHQMIFNSTYSAFLIGAIVAITQIIRKKSNRKTKIPFGPYMIVGMFLAMLFYFVIQLHSNSQFLGNL